MTSPQIKPTALEGVIEITPVRHGDDRGWFSETWNQADLIELGIDTNWVQDNESLSGPKGTLRGIHFQIPPAAQNKLIRVVNGSVLDVAVDLRLGSPTFSRYVAVELRADLGNQLFIPEGFGHAFCTLEANCRVAYKVSRAYAPDHDRVLRFDDPGVGIDWPLSTDELVLSPKDAAAPGLEKLIESGSLFSGN